MPQTMKINRVYRYDEDHHSAADDENQSRGEVNDSAIKLITRKKADVRSLNRGRTFVIMLISHV